MPGYLGNDPSGSATKIARQTYTTSGAATTDFTFTSGYDVGYLDVYVNGERQTKGKNFTASDGSTFRVLNGGVGTGSTVEAIAYKTFNLATVDFDDLGNTGNLTLTGDISGANATFTGDVSIGGTLTYEDVTNIDSVGVVTARAGVDIITGGIDIVGNTTGLNVSGVGTFTGGVGIADSIFHLSDDNTAIRFPAADVFTVETAGDERIRVTGANLLVGTSTARTNLNDSTIETRIQIEAAGDNDSAALSIISNAGTTNSDKRSGLLVLGRTRGTSIGATTVVVADDQVGMIEFKGMDGTSFTTAASIKAQVDAAVGTDDMPGRLVFLTSADGSGVPTERLRIDSSGRVLISGEAALTSTSQSHTLQVASASDANAIAIHGRASDDIGELSYYEADKSTKLGEVQYRRDHVNFRHRVGEIRFATGGTTDRMIINSDGDVNITGITTASQLFEGTTRVATTGKAIAMAMLFG